MAYLGITQQELIFGKKSFDDVSVITSTKRIDPKTVTKPDSILVKKTNSSKQDSLTLDSLKQDSIKKSQVKKILPKTNK